MDNMESYIQTLESSPTFHMSLGSKELFHSNFLHWLSVCDWEFFLCIMKKIFDKESFWWESDYSPQEGNLEVRRESNNFDLSIYVLINKKWIPVLVLENKVKSIPYKKQLQRYQEKAVSGWRKGDKKGDRSLSFILLTLWNNNLGGILPQKEDDPLCEWKKVSYGELSELLDPEKNKLKTSDLNLSILKDYIGFISSLSNLANNCWKLNKVDPWSKVYSEKNNDYIRYKKLRIHDLWEKIHYEQLLAMLIEQLKSTDNIKDNITLDEDTYKNGKVYCKAGYSRGLGAIEAHVKKEDDIEYIIQVQGNEYRRAIVSNNLVDNESYYKRTFSDTTLQAKFAFYFKDDNKPDPYSFGKFRYSKSVISDDTSINIIIKAMCDDIDYIVKKINTK